MIRPSFLVVVLLLVAVTSTTTTTEATTTADDQSVWTSNSSEKTNATTRRRPRRRRRPQLQPHHHHCRRQDHQLDLRLTKKQHPQQQQQPLPVRMTPPNFPWIVGGGGGGGNVKDEDYDNNRKVVNDQRKESSNDNDDDNDGNNAESKRGVGVKVDKNDEDDNDNDVVASSSTAAITTMIQRLFPSTIRNTFHSGLISLKDMSGRFGPPIIITLLLAKSIGSTSSVDSRNWIHNIMNNNDNNVNGIQLLLPSSFLFFYSLALLGSSCGFQTFLYFITIGYAFGVTVPLTVALAMSVMNHHRPALPLLSIVQSCMMIVWGIRLSGFLLWREYVAWPALHQKIVELQSRMVIPYISKVLCWIVYSFFYVALMSNGWSRLLKASAASATATVATVKWNDQWGPMGYIGLVLQAIGLCLETIADWQKTTFKTTARHSWCSVGLWGWSTHPHYLGEGMFWIGCWFSHGFHSIWLSTLASVGVIFILSVLKGSTKSLAMKQKEKYGQKPEFCDFHRTHNVFGPKHGSSLWKR